MYLADATKNAAAVEELHKVGACLEGYQDTDPSQTAALALALLTARMKKQAQKWRQMRRRFSRAPT